MAVQTYKDLMAWQTGMTLVERCYEMTAGFPVDERFGLTAQVRRTAISIPANIAEGAMRRRRKAYANHVSIALGSHAELETYIELAGRLGYITGHARETIADQCAQAGRLLFGLHRSLTSRTDW